MYRTILGKFIAFLFILTAAFISVQAVALADSLYPDPSLSPAAYWDYTDDGSSVTVKFFSTSDTSAVYDTLTIPNEINGKPVTKIENLFNTYQNFHHLVIPSSVTQIGDYAVYYCSGVQSVDIQGNVTSIGVAAFRGCTNLVSVNIPGTVTGIGTLAFMECPSLKSVTIPAGVTELPESCFDGCTNLDSVTLTNGLKTIGDQAFCDCASLESLTIPASVNNIDIGAFYRCDSLTNVAVDAANGTYASLNGVIYNKTKTTVDLCPPGKSGAVALPSTVTTVGAAAFAECSRISGVTLPGGVISIGDFAFSGCTGLTGIILPSGLKVIGMGAFIGCSGLKSIVIPPLATSIGEAAFMECTGLKSFTFPDGVTTVNAGLFQDCVGLADVTLPASLSSIGDGAFRGCAALKKCIFKGNLPVIASSAYPAQGFTAYYHLGNTTWASYSAQPKQAYVWVTAFPQNGASAYKVLSSVSDSHIASPAAPVRAGYQFLGWYKEPACKNGWNFSAAVITGDISAYAGWAAKPAAPLSPKAVPTSYNSIKVTWKAVPGATGYELFRSTSGSANFTLLTTTANAYFTNTGVNTGTAYYYKVRAYRLVSGVNVCSNDSAVASAKTALAAPASVKAARASSGSIKVSWGAVAGANMYEVWCASPKSGKYSQVGATTARNFVNTGLKAGTTYYYKVRAYRMVSGKKVYGAFSAIVSAKA